MALYPDQYQDLNFDLEPYRCYRLTFKYSALINYIPKDFILGNWFYNGTYFLIYDIIINKWDKKIYVYVMPYGSLANLIVYGVITILVGYVIYLNLTKIEEITEEAPAVGGMIISIPLILVIIIGVLIIFSLIKK